MFCRQDNSLRESSCSQLRAPHPHGARRYLLSLPGTQTQRDRDGLSALITTLRAPAVHPDAVALSLQLHPSHPNPLGRKHAQKVPRAQPGALFQAFRGNKSTSERLPPELLSQDKSFLPRIKAARDEGCKAEDALLSVNSPRITCGYYRGRTSVLFAASSLRQAVMDGPGWRFPKVQGLLAARLMSLSNL